MGADGVSWKKHGNVADPVENDDERRVPAKPGAEPDRDRQCRDGRRHVRDVHQVQREEPGERIDKQVGDLEQNQPAHRAPVPHRREDLTHPRPRRPPRYPKIPRAIPATGNRDCGGGQRFPQARSEPCDGGEPGEDQVAVPPAAPAGEHHYEHQRPGNSPDRPGQVPARHHPRLPVRPRIHQLGLCQRDIGTGKRIEGHESAKQNRERPGSGHRQQRKDEQDAAAEHGPPPSARVVGQDPQR
jgi:hypothetical protein